MQQHRHRHSFLCYMQTHLVRDDCYENESRARVHIGYLCK